MSSNPAQIETRLAGVILAAGAGKRFGCPKALARMPEPDPVSSQEANETGRSQHDGESWLLRAVNLFRDAGLSTVTIVVGAEADRVIAESGVETKGTAMNISWRENSSWKDGRTGSIAIALQSMPNEVQGIILHQVDFPFVLPSTIVTLISGFNDANSDQAAGQIILPANNNRRGHPILIGRQIWPEIAALGADDPLSDVIHRDQKRLICLDVNDPGIHRNLNAPSDMA